MDGKGAPASSFGVAGALVWIDELNADVDGVLRQLQKIIKFDDLEKFGSGQGLSLGCIDC